MKRKGFTLIELMVVIAIIIILAAIAIPNYLSMTARAKRSRVASDFAAIATSLETYKTDWGTYPATPNATPQAIAGTTAAVSPSAYTELVGTTTAVTGGYHNVPAGTAGILADAAGDMPPIQYMTPTILSSMTNPYGSTDYTYTYTAATDSWKLTATVSSTDFLTRTNLDATVKEGPSS